MHFEYLAKETYDSPTDNAALADLRLSWAHFTEKGKFWLGLGGGEGKAGENVAHYTVAPVASAQYGSPEELLGCPLQ